MSIDPRENHYETLGVSKDASADEIKKAYRRLAKRFHPDKTGGDKTKEARFKKISGAYDLLSDPEKRSQYDAMRSGGIPHGFGAEGFGQGFNQGGATSGFGGMGGGLGDLFSQMFSGGFAGNGGNVRYSFYNGDGRPQDASPFGRQRQPQKPKNGRELRRRERKVRASDGSWLVQKGRDIYSDVRVQLDEAILGTAKQVATLTGMAKVKIPPGTSSGLKLRLKDRGAEGRDSKGKTGRGNHYVTVHIDVPKQLDDKAKKLLVQFMQRTKKKNS